MSEAVDGDPAVWGEGRDVLTGEQRGSVAIERYINPNNPNIPNYASQGLPRGIWGNFTNGAC